MKIECMKNGFKISINKSNIFKIIQPSLSFKIHKHDQIPNITPFHINHHTEMSTPMLHIRPSSANTGGSILLKTEEGLWDCVKGKEWNEVRYTEENWMEKFEKLYGTLQDDEKQKMIEEIANEENYKYKNLRNPKIHWWNTSMSKISSGKLHNIVHYEWNAEDGSLELFLTEEIASTSRSIAGTEYTSILLMFEPVTFDNSVELKPPGLKRTRSDSF